jgi:ubiquinone/menaquinone biosynthesis C-methylase UbiE
MRTELEVLEIGCGTGLLTLQVASRVKSLTAIDTAQGMIDALQAKLDTHNITNIHPLCLLLQDSNDPAIAGKKFNLIISHLVLHHVPSLQLMLDTMYEYLAPGGLIALTDFERFGPGSRKFHPESKMDGVERHGITKMEMECCIKDAGFNKVQVCQAFKLKKEVELEGGETGQMEFPFLICMGVRKK